MATQVAAGKQKRVKLEAVVRCAEEDLFAKLTFICDQKTDLHW
jgi:hypothetical protein